MNLIKPALAHWQGRNDLLLTLLITVLGLRLLTGFLQGYLPSSVLPTWLVFSVLLLVWQVVGALRAGDLYLKVRGGMVLYWCTIAIVVIAALLTTLQFLDGLSRIYPPEAEPVAEVKPLEISADAKTLYLNGELSWSLRQSFLQTLQEHTAVETVQIHSDGGLVFVGRALALTIKELKLNTRIEKRCLSACTIVFMAGSKRTMAAQSELGFHQYALSYANTSPGVSPAEEQQVDREMFRAQGVSEVFLQQIFEAKPEKMAFFTKDRLDGTGVLTEE
ncbi:hypothetical protein AB833_22405 [Chromatiales bacterium (ex Bugula neritina AB1)]|nr:hypothetical protein AB833_22405 [Chromatiales bacterium (ex Bugula neritina AB1)]